MWRNLVFTGPGPYGGIQLTQNIMEGLPNRNEMQDVSGAHNQQLPGASELLACDERWPDDLIITSKEEWFWHVIAGYSLGCSDFFNGGVQDSESDKHVKKQNRNHELEGSSLWLF